MALRDRLKKNLKTATVEIDGESVEIQELGGSARIELSKLEDGDFLSQAWFVWEHGVVNNDFTREDMIKLFDVDSEFVTDLFTKIIELSGLTPDSEAELAKK
jgi:hypothetical protein